ncbi:MAG: hypothetical protein ABEK10_04755 [Candidatus Nanosalina sp.]
MSSLLILANEFEDEGKRFEEYFDQVNSKSLAEVMIDSETGKVSNVLVDGENIEEWDAVYLKPEPKAFNYTRVLLEVLSVKNVKCNIDTSSIFILTKKPYLAKVLADKANSIPRQASISTEKGMTELEKDLDFPVVAKKYSDLQLTETKIFEEFNELKNFAELTEHGKDFLMIQEHKEDEEVFELLYIDGKIISLKVDGSPWRETEETSYSYHGISDTQRKVVEKAVESIGTSICRVRLRGEKITDMDTDPKLEMFKEKSGKNVYGRVADYLKNGDEE